MDELPPQLEAGLAAVDGAIDEVEVALAPLLAAPLSQTRTDVRFRHSNLPSFLCVCVCVRV